MEFKYIIFFLIQFTVLEVHEPQEVSSYGFVQKNGQG